MENIVITRKDLENYREIRKKKIIPLLEMELKDMRTTDSGIGNSTIFDYRTGFGRPQSVVGFDKEKYENRKKTLESKKENAKTIEKWIDNIEDGQARCIFKMYYNDGMCWEKIADKTGYSKSPDYPRKMVRDKYLDECNIK